jgi:E3 ubiquitin-protein ligase CCNP1IP1
MQTPSTNRQRLIPTNVPAAGPTTRIELATIHQGGTPGGIIPQYRTTPRQPLASLNSNSISPSGFVGYGMSAGLKVSNPAATIMNGLGRPVVRARGLDISVSHLISLT